jgi:hypothetical protein
MREETGDAFIFGGGGYGIHCFLYGVIWVGYFKDKKLRRVHRSSFFGGDDSRAAGLFAFFPGVAYRLARIRILAWLGKAVLNSFLTRHSILSTNNGRRM